LNRSPFRSSPPSQPSPYRYLGRGGGERPVRLQIVMALVATLVLVAVPLYLWRRPQPESIPSADAAVASANGTKPPFAMTAFGAAAGPNSSGNPLEIAPVKTVKCSDGKANKLPPERCEGIRTLEDILVKAIKDSQSCAPATKQSFVMSYVLEANFTKKHISVFMGRSTTLAKSRRKELLKCVEKALQAPDWDRIPHQHQNYSLNTVVTYPPSSGPEPQPGVAELPESPKKSTGTTPKKPAPPKHPKPHGVKK
jgi:hypothetical protein